jgi:hypothetical protein
MKVHSLAARFIVFLFCLFVSANEQHGIFTSPPNSPALTLVLNDEYLIQWTTEWPSVKLWVFCSGSEDGDGVGPNGANLLRGK